MIILIDELLQSIPAPLFLAELLLIVQLTNCGLFEDTIPDYLKVAKPIALLHVDCDLYSSTKCVFDNLNHLIKKGTVIVFDEWRYADEDGKLVQEGVHEKKCFYEWVEENKRTFDFIRNKTHEEQVSLVITN